MGKTFRNPDQEWARRAVEAMLERIARWIAADAEQVAWRLKRRAR
jgi:hypothetical protein